MKTVLFFVLSLVALSKPSFPSPLKEDPKFGFLRANNAIVVSENDVLCDVLDVKPSNVSKKTKKPHVNTISIPVISLIWSAKCWTDDFLKNTFSINDIRYENGTTTISICLAEF